MKDRPKAYNHIANTDKYFFPGVFGQRFSYDSREHRDLEDKLIAGSFAEPTDRNKYLRFKISVSTAYR
jgi:hypothetical protein